MRFARNSNVSGKKPILIIFIIAFLAIGIAIIYGSIQARKAKANIEDGRAKIELVQDESGRTVLTDDLLRSDYNVYVKTSNRNLMIMTIVMVALFLSLVGWFIVQLVNFVRGRMRGDPSNIMEITSLALALVFIVILGIFFYNGTLSSLNKQPDDPESATISLEYAQVTRKDTKTVKTGRGRHKTSHKEYNIYLADGRTLSVVKYVYDEVEDAGNYYIGKNKEGAIFGMYPEKSYCMEEF